MITPEMLNAAKVLARSDRGRRVANQLLTFFEGDSCGLDSQGRHAVQTMIEMYLVGRNPQSTVDLLHQVFDGDIKNDA